MPNDEDNDYSIWLQRVHKFIKYIHMVNRSDSKSFYITDDHKETVDYMIHLLVHPGVILRDLTLSLFTINKLRMILYKVPFSLLFDKPVSINYEETHQFFNSDIRLLY
jgi:hypothetical protein